ncbi:MAG: hypothetical protein ABSC77_10960 [Terracidiphilus sp.]|jgi:sugar lactone lactonase YvrE
MQKRFAPLFLSMFILAGAQIMTAQSQALGRPVAIDKLPSGSLYALDAQGAVHAVDFPGGKPTVTGSFSFPSGWVASDIVSTQKDGQDILFIAYNIGLTGQVGMFSTTGTQLKWWNFPSGVAGITYDSANSTLYIASGRNSEIFAINLSKDNGPNFIASTPGSQRLGPLLYDSKENALLVGDLVMGTIYKLDLTKRKSTVLFGGLKSPLALKLSADGASLFVADTGARKIVRFSTTHANSAPIPFAQISQFHSPSGLAWVGDRLAVSDDEARKLFIFSSSGSFEDTLPAAH